MVGNNNRYGTSPDRLSSAVLVVSMTPPAGENDEDVVVTENDSESASTKFVSPRMQVYIEDTDAYGIMYNTNYLRAYDRALHMSTQLHNPDIHKGTMSSQHEGWSITSFEQQKFKSSPKLGEEYVIRGELKVSADNYEIWDMEMTNPEGDVTYNSITNLQISKLNNDAVIDDGMNEFALEANPEPYNTYLDQKTNPFFATNFTVYRDEIDTHWPNHIPLRSILNYMERCRSASLGGPDALRSLQEDDSVVVVVTGIQSCSLIDEGVFCFPGQIISSDSFLVSKRKGMVLECYQTIQYGSKRIAQGQVNLMLLDSKTRRPTRNIPESIQRMLKVA